MKKIAAILIALAAVSMAHADYSQAVARQRFCANMGGIASLAYGDKERGTPKAEVMDRVSSMMKEERTAEMLRFSIDYAYAGATSSKDAQTKSWAHCMDGTY